MKTKLIRPALYILRMNNKKHKIMYEASWRILNAKWRRNFKVKQLMRIVDNEQIAES